MCKHGDKKRQGERDVETVRVTGGVEIGNQPNSPVNNGRILNHATDGIEGIRSKA